jgi:hypothetical protein
MSGVLGLELADRDGLAVGQQDLGAGGEALPAAESCIDSAVCG